MVRKILISISDGLFGTGLKNDATANQKPQKVDSVYLDIAFSVGETFDQPSKSLRSHLKMQHPDKQYQQCLYE